MTALATINQAELVLDSGYSVSSVPGRSFTLSAGDEWFKGAPVRRNDTPYLNRDGSFPDKSSRGAKLVPISGHAVAASRSDAGAIMDELRAFLATGEEGKLTVNDIDLGRRWAYVSIADGADIRWNKRLDVFFTLYLVMNDPFQYGDKVTSETVSSGGTITLPNAGTANAAPLFRVVGDVGAGGFTITASDGSLLKYTGAASGEIVLDAANTEVWRAGVEEGQRLTVRQWTEVAPKANETYTFVATGSTATLTGEIYSKWY